MAQLSEMLLKPLQTIVFQKTPGLMALAAAQRNIWVVGKKAALCKAAEQLSEVLKLPMLAKQAEALTAGYSAVTAESPWMDGDKLRKVTLVALPEAAGRLVSPVRPDVIAKQLHGKVAGHQVVLAVGDGDVLAAGLAVARCLSPYTTKTEKPLEESVCNVSFHGCEPSDEALKRLNLTAESIRVAQGLVDMPPNVLYPTSYKDFALQAVQGIPGVSHTLIEGEELQRRGYGLLFAVGKCAVTPPCLLVLTHAGDGAADRKGVALVGKGITFDTGGAALKPRDGMIGMKRDMGGSAGMLGAFLTLAKGGGLPNGQPLHCVLCIAENSIGSTCFLQDDIIKGYSGLTVEINNTDAEGRLVLAEGASHAAKHLDCELVVDMGTLTGAQGITTGTHHALILATDEALEKEAVAAGKLSGDMVHPGLFAPELLMQEYDSDFADMRNSVKNRSNAQSSAAGLFIHRHLMNCGYTGRWLHVDMAFPADAPLGNFATGWGVGFLSTLLQGGSGDVFAPSSRI